MILGMGRLALPSKIELRRSAERHHLPSWVISVPEIAQKPAAFCIRRGHDSHARAPAVYVGLSYGDLERALLADGSGGLEGEAFGHLWSPLRMGRMCIRCTCHVNKKSAPGARDVVNAALAGLLEGLRHLDKQGLLLGGQKTDRLQYRRREGRRQRRRIWITVQQIASRTTIQARCGLQ